MVADPLVDGALGRFAGELRRTYRDRLVRVTLFGSYARGTATEDSDVDVLVVVAGLTQQERSFIYELAAEVMLDTGVHLAPLAMSEDEYREHERLERLLVDEIRTDGVAL